MFCQNCQKQEASIHVKQNINGNISEMHLCAQCAQQMKANGFSYPVMVADFLQALISGKSWNSLKEPQLVLQGTCPVCGTTAERIRQIGKMGCGGCYRHFAAQMDFLLRRIHGRGRHEGKTPSRLGEIIRNEANLEQLKAQLRDCIEREDFERAALLRDQIRDLEGKGEGGTAHE